MYDICIKNVVSLYYNIMSINLNSDKMKPTIKMFPILSIDNKNGLKKDDFITPKIYGELDKRAFLHTFKNGITAVVTKVSRFSYYRTIFDFQPFEKNIQSTSHNDNFYKITQYSDEFKGFITIFIKED